MGFNKIQPLSVTDLFVQQIENLILSGELAIGEQLPPARELSAEMGVSRTVISAGLIDLEKLGFVEIIPRKGVYVTDYRRRGSIETLVAIMRYNGGSLRKAEVKSIIETRGALDVLCLRLVIENATNAELNQLESIIQELQAATLHEQAAECTFRFYYELCVLSGNMLLPLIYYSFYQISIHLWTLSCRQYGLAAFYKIRRDIYSAILNRDFETAVQISNNLIEKAIYGNLSVFASD